PRLLVERLADDIEVQQPIGRAVRRGVGEADAADGDAVAGPWLVSPRQRVNREPHTKRVGRDRHDTAHRLHDAGEHAMSVPRVIITAPRSGPEGLSAMLKRTHTCGALRAKEVGQTVSLMGWVNTYRDHGGVIFI